MMRHLKPRFWDARHRRMYRSNTEPLDEAPLTRPAPRRYLCASPNGDCAHHAQPRTALQAAGLKLFCGALAAQRWLRNAASAAR